MTDTSGYTELTPQTLPELIDKAERNTLWLWCRYQDLWFSPAQLREANAQGRFRWGPVNWELRDPKERLAEADRRAKAAADTRDAIARELGA